MSNPKKHGTKIEWTHFPGYKGETWTPWGGCTKVSPGCKNCWALRQANRFKGHNPKYEGTVENGDWTGKIVRARYDRFFQPLRWRDPRAIFVSSMSDFFHEGADEWRKPALGVMDRCPQHLFLIPTKRVERIGNNPPRSATWPWPNVILGASIENQETAEERIPILLRTPAAMRFLSIEPLLGDIDLTPWLPIPRAKKLGHPECSMCGEFYDDMGHDCPSNVWQISWVIVGGESGAGARPMHPAWPLSIRDQCQKAGVPFFFKQHGEWVASPCKKPLCGGPKCEIIWPDGHRGSGNSLSNKGMFEHVHRVGKKEAGRLLDGRPWEQFPNV